MTNLTIDGTHTRYANMIQRIPLPICIIDETAKLVFKNKAFEISRTQTNIFVQSEILTLAHSESHFLLKQSLQNLFSGKKQQDTIFIQGQSQIDTLWLSLTYDSQLREVCVTVLSPDLMSLDQASMEKRLRHIFNLSGMEARCALLLTHGSTAKEIANERGVSVPTIRTQLKAIREKMGVKTSLAIAAKVSKLAMPLNIQTPIKMMEAA